MGISISVWMNIWPWITEWMGMWITEWMGMWITEWMGIWITEWMAIVLFTHQCPGETGSL